jgi:rod shape-determining protein MreD
MKLHVFILLISVFAVLSQVHFLSFFPFSSYVSLQIVVIVTILMQLERFTVVRWYALLMGFFIDMYSPYPFGVHMISLTSAAIVCEMLFRRLLTNRSVYVMLLCIGIATFVDRCMWFGLSSALAQVRLYDLQPDFQSISFSTLVGNGVLGLFVFYCIIGIRVFMNRPFPKKYLVPPLS